MKSVFNANCLFLAPGFLGNCSRLRHQISPQHCIRRQCIIHAQSKDAEPDWEEEMSIFKKRTLKPSQLEALRKLEEEKVDLGRVLYCKDSIAIIEGLNNDADVGTSISFSSGAKGVLLWRRSDNVVFSLLLGGADLVSIGDGVECRVRGILQLVDESDGPSTKKDYEPTLVPVGEALCGCVVDFLGRRINPDGTPGSDPNPIGNDARLPLLNAQPDMESREQIAEALVTGVKALDILTPLGRGQVLQVSGPQGSGKTQLCVDAVMGQRGANVRCVYAAVGCTPEQLTNTVAQLEAHGCMEYTTVVAATSDRTLGEQYAAMLTACSVAEATRNSGGHSLVILNDVSVMVRMWEMITVAMADLGSVAIETEKSDVAELTAAEAENLAALEQARDGEEEGSKLAAAEKSSEQEGRGSTSSMSSSSSEEGEDDNLVEYEGMLVSVAAAQRRRFFSSLIQRCAKMHRRLKGGSMTSLLVVPGVPATGQGRKVAEKILKYRHLSEEQKAKLLHVLEGQSSGSKGSVRVPGPQELRTEVVEELMSITDGQVVLRTERDSATGGVFVDPQMSISRIGSRAYSPAVADLAPLVRFELAQAEDARRYAANAGSDPAAVQALRRAAVIEAALPQPQRTTCPLEEQVVQLMALQEGLLDAVALSEVPERLLRVTEEVKRLCPGALEEVATTRRLTGTAKAAICAALTTSCAALVVDEV